MKISEVILKLEEAKAKHGDVVCETFQHPEESEGGSEPVSSFYFSEREKTLTIS